MAGRFGSGVVVVIRGRGGVGRVGGGGAGGGAVGHFVCLLLCGVVLCCGGCFRW